MSAEQQNSSDVQARDTIVAVSTARGRAERAVIRLSGDMAVPAASARFIPADEAPRCWNRTYTVTRGTLRLEHEGVPVPVLLYVMRRPYSYTREDVVEVHVPGSPALLDMLLDELLTEEDVRMAQPGEFTRRAYLNGRIDLAQAEAVLSVIKARNRSELLAAEARLGGATSRACSEIQERISELRSHMEAALDFAQHGIDLISEEDVLDELDGIDQALSACMEGARGELASDGMTHVAIVGPPNVGKSSLLNRLAEEERAIVNPQPGTTRDAVTAELTAGGVEFAMTDTAGLRESDDELERASGRQARDRLESAQLVLLVVDGSQPLNEEALECARAVPADRTLVAVNKCDLPEEADEERLRELLPDVPVLHTSALTGEGLEGLRQELGRVVLEGGLDASAADCTFNARQRDAARRAREEIQHARTVVEDGMGYEFAALHLREANETLGEVTQQVSSQDVLSRIFSRFCIGK